MPDRLRDALTLAVAFLPALVLLLCLFAMDGEEEEEYAG